MNEPTVLASSANGTKVTTLPAPPNLPQVFDAQPGVCKNTLLRLVALAALMSVVKGEDDEGDG